MQTIVDFQDRIQGLVKNNIRLNIYSILCMYQVHTVPFSVILVKILKIWVKKRYGDRVHVLGQYLLCYWMLMHQLSAWFFFFRITLECYALEHVDQDIKAEIRVLTYVCLERWDGQLCIQLYYKKYWLECMYIWHMF